MELLRMRSEKGGCLGEMVMCDCRKVENLF